MRKKLIKAFIIIGIVLLGMALLCLLLSVVLNIIRAGKEVPDVSTDITEDKQYMSLYRDLVYDEYGDSEPITETNYADAPAAARFFYDYFACLKKGDNASHGSFYTKHYLENNKLRKMTPQKLYDITVALYDKTDDDVHTEIYTVKFKIKDNDKTLFDVESGISKTLYFKLVLIDGELKINDIIERKVVYD